MKEHKTSVSAPAGGTDDGEDWVEMERKANEAIARGDLETAMAIAEHYVSFCPEVSDINRAVDLYHHQLALLNTLGIDRYGVSWIHECMGRKYEEEGDFHNALATYAKILEIFENDNSPVVWKLYIGEREEAMYPENETHIAFIWHKMAVVHGKMGEYDAAHILFRKVLEICTKNCEFIRSECSSSDVHQDMGDMEMQRRDYRKALEYYTSALRYEPDKIDSESDHEIRECIRKARQMMNWTEKYSKMGDE